MIHYTERISYVRAVKGDQGSYVIIACLAIEGASEAALEHLWRSDGELRGRFSFGHWRSGGKRENQGKEEGDL